MIREVREFSSEDAANVAQMWNESDSGWPGGFTGGNPMTAEQVLIDQMRTRFLSVFIAFADGKAVGYCSLLPFWQSTKTAYVGLLNAHPAYHGQGFGRDLLRAALARAVALGYDQLDLHTWAGNLKAVPLYKKMGYFWVPDTSVHMECYLPAIFRQDYVRDFFGLSTLGLGSTGSGRVEADSILPPDWYQCFQRDLTVRPDEWTEEGMRVYPYEFERAGRRLRVLIDPESRGITAVETSRFSVAARFAGRRAPIGMPAEVVWTLAPKGESLAATLIAGGEDGLPLALQRCLTLGGSRAPAVEPTTIRELVVPAGDARPRPKDDAAHRVLTTAVVGGQVIRLSTGLRLCPPVALSSPDGLICLQVGIAKDVSLLVQSNLAASARVTIQLAASAELIISPSRFELEIPAGEARGIRFRLGAVGKGLATAGASDLEARLTITGEAESGDAFRIEPVPTRLPVHRLADGTVVASSDGERVYLTSPQLRVEVSRRGAALTLRDTATGAWLGDYDSKPGPPFGQSDLGNREFSVELAADTGRAVARLAIDVPSQPGIRMERRFELVPGPTVRIDHLLTNSGDTRRACQVLVEGRTGIEAGRAAVPTSAGLFVDQAIGFPDWRDPSRGKPDAWAENWLARDGDGRVYGWVWEQASTAELGNWGCQRFIFDFAEAVSGGSARTPSLWIYAGPGTYEDVRRFWRTHLAPNASDLSPSPRPALEAAILPPILLGDEAMLKLSNQRERPLVGTATLEIDGADAPIATPSTVDLASLAFGRDLTTALRLSAAPNRIAGAWSGKINLKSDSWDQQLPVTVIRAGTAGVVAVREGEREGRKVVEIDNGRLSLTIAPSFAGSLIELIGPSGAPSGRANHLLSAFPQERPLSDLNPWFGGLTPVCRPASDHGTSQPMAAAEYSWERTTRPGLLGQTWHGVALTAQAEHRDLRGVGFRVEYLTLGQSNLVAVITRVDTKGAPVRVAHGVNISPAPGGAVDGQVARSVLSYFERCGLWTHERNSGVYSDTEGWVAAGNPATSDVLAVVGNTRLSQVQLWDEAPDALALGVTSRSRGDDPTSTREIACLLVLAGSVEEARLYRTVGAALGCPTPM